MSEETYIEFKGNDEYKLVKVQDLQETLEVDYDKQSYFAYDTYYCIEKIVFDTMEECQDEVEFFLQATQIGADYRTNYKFELINQDSQCREPGDYAVRYDVDVVDSNDKYTFIKVSFEQAEEY
jgi:hypothetical protein